MKQLHFVVLVGAIAGVDEDLEVLVTDWPDHPAEAEVRTVGGHWRPLELIGSAA